MKVSFQKKIEELDGWIRIGQLEKTRHELRLLLREDLPRPWTVGFARIARRVGLPYVSARLLNPIVRPSGRRALEASAEEKLEYAACLVSLGVPEEALALLESLDPNAQPEILLIHSFALFSRWNYRDAIPLLTRYTGMEKIDPYQRLVGLVNLAAALVYERRSPAAVPLLQRLRRETSERQLALLQSGALELSAQNCIFASEWKLAQGFIEECKRIQDPQGLPAFFTRKWEAVLNLKKSPRDARALRVLKAIRQEAEARKHWETIRDCDRYQALFLRSEPLFHRVYAGTPFVAFRAHFEREFGGASPPPDPYLRSLGPPGRARLTLDLTSRHAFSRKGRPEPGRLLTRALRELASDFYRPTPLPTLYYRLYPDELFNPLSSRNRIHQLLHRFRDRLQALGLPLFLDAEKPRAFRLGSSLPVALILPLNLGDAKDSPELKELQQRWPETRFSNREALELLGRSRRTTVRVLNQGVERKLLSRSGKGESVTYQSEKK